MVRFAIVDREVFMWTRKRVPAVFYMTTSGQEPVRRWLVSLSKEDRKAVGEDIRTVEFGCPVGMPVCRPIREGLYEVRTNLSMGRISRVLFCFHAGYMVLLHGFIKKTRKVPDQELQLAWKRKREVEHG